MARDTYTETDIRILHSRIAALEQLIEVYENSVVEQADKLFREIAERKNMEDALRGSEEKFRVIAAAAPDAVIMLDNTGDVMFWNRSAEKIFGYTNEEAMGRQLYTLIIPERFRDDHKKGFSLFRTTGEGTLIGKTFEVPALRKDGTEFPIELSLAAVKIEDQWRATGIARDITERTRMAGEIRQLNTELEKKVEERTRQLLERETRIRRLVDSNIIGVIFWQLDGVIIDANDAFLAMVGYTREELLMGKIRWPDMTPPEYRAVDERAVEELRTAGITAPFEKEYARKDGSRVPVLLGCALFEKSADSGVAFVIDLTERKQLEQQLSRRVHHLDVVERISRISLSSKSIEELLERILDEILTVFNADRAWFLYPCDPDAPSWTVPMERTRPEWPGAFARGMVMPMTTEVAGIFREALAYTEPLPHGPATSRPIPAAITEQFSVQSQVMMALRPRVGSPWLIGLHHCARARAYSEDELLIFKDIGQRVADGLSSMIILKDLRESTRQLESAQEELVRKEKLSTLGQLAGIVGHELRNPLGVMSNAVYFLKTVHAGGDETTREYLDIIKKEIENSQRIIGDLLDFARTKPPQVQPVFAGDLVRQSLAKCAVQENITAALDIPDDLPRLRVDPNQMGQVLVNFINNAVQAMPEGGAVRIAARVTKDEGRGTSDEKASIVQASEASGRPSSVEISVSDTGTGITPENMKKLFHPLFTTKTKGIGLGLVACKNLVEANGGRITVESEPGKGTAFTVTLPVERREARAEEGEP